MGFIDRLRNAWNILKTSLLFIGRDKSLLIIPFLLILCAILMILFFIFGFGWFTASHDVHYTNIQVYGVLILFLFISYLWSVFLGSAQAWMVYEVAQGRDATLASGAQRALQNIKDILAFAVVATIVDVIIEALRGKQPTTNYGAEQIARNTAASFLGLGSRIMKKLVLPAMIVSERNFGEAVKQLREGIRAIPEIGAYEIGMRPLNIIYTFLYFGLAYAVGMYLHLVTIAGLIFIIGFISQVILNIVIDQTYYTLLYLTIIEKKKVKGLDVSLTPLFGA